MTRLPEHGINIKMMLQLCYIPNACYKYNRTRQGWAGVNCAGLAGTGLGWTWLDWAGLEKTGKDWEGLSWTGRARAWQGRAGRG